MIRKIYPVTDFNGGYASAKDGVYLDENETPVVFNAERNRMTLIHSYGLDKLGNKLDGKVLYMQDLTLPGLLEGWVAITPRSFWVWNPSINEWERKNPTAPIDSLSVTVDYGTDVEVIFDGGVPPTTFDITTSAALWNYQYEFEFDGSVIVPGKDISASEEVRFTVPNSQISDRFIIRLLEDPGAHPVINFFGMNAPVLFKGESYADGVQVHETFIWTNGIDPIQIWNGETLSELSVDAPKARFLGSYYNHLIAAGDVTYPYRLFWASIGDPTNWTSGTSGFVDLVESDDIITGIHNDETRMVIAGTKTLWDINYVGGNIVFAPVVIETGFGSIAQQAYKFIDDQNGSIFISRFGPRQLLNVSSQSLTTEIKDDILGNFPIIDSNRVTEQVAAYCPEDPSYRVLAASTHQDMLEYVYDLETKSWWVNERPGAQFIASVTGHSMNRWLDGVGTWNDQTQKWITPNIEAGRYTRLYCVDDQIYIKSMTTNNPKHFVYQSRDFVFGQATRVVGFYVYAEAIDFKVECSLDGGELWRDIGFFKLDLAKRDQFFFSQNLTTLRIRYRITSFADPFRLVWFSPSFISKQRPEVTPYREF